MNDEELKKKFRERMRQLCDEARAIGYTPTRFMQMLETNCAVVVAKELLASGKLSEGLTRLWEEKRLDISMEATILQAPWRKLFTDSELDIAEKRLKELGYAPSDQ